MRGLKRLDYFGRNIPILFKNERNHKTTFGGLITLVLTIGFSVFLYIQYLDSKNPRQLVRNQVHVNNAKYYDLNSGILNIVFGLQDDNFDHYIDESLYSIEAILISYSRTFDPDTGNKTNTVTKKQLELESCTEDHFTIDSTRNYFRSLQFQGMYCFQKGQELPIQGDFDSERYSYIQLIVKICQNKPYCKPPSVIEEAYKLTNIAFYFTDNIIELSQSDNPFQQTTLDAYITSGIPLSKDVTLFYQNTKVIDKGGLYNEQIAVREQLTFDRVVEMTLPYDPSTGILYRVTFRHTKSQEVNVVRNFQPWSVFLSQIGGFYQFLLAIGCILCYPVSQIDLNIQLINSLFNIDQAQEDDNASSPSNRLRQKGQKNDNKSNCLFQMCGNKKNKPPSNYSTDGQLNNRNAPKDQIPLPIKSQNSISKHGTLAVLDEQEEKITQQQQLEKGKLRLKKSFTVLSQVEQYGQNNSAIAPLQKNISRSNQRKNKQSILGGTLIMNSEFVITKIAKVKDSLKQMNLFKKYFSINSVQFSLWNYITLNIMCCKRYQDKRKQLDKSVSQLYSQLDVHNILQKLIEVDKIKMLILNDQQLKLFEYLPQPKIFSNRNNQQQINHQDSLTPINRITNNCVLRQSDLSIIQKESHHPKANKIDILYQNNKSILQKAEDAWYALKELRSRPFNQTEIDKKLMQMIDPQFFEVFNELSQTQTQVQNEESQYPHPNSEIKNIEINQNIKQLKQGMQIGSTNSNFVQFKLDSCPTLNKLENEPFKKLPKQENDFKKKSDFAQIDQLLGTNFPMIQKKTSSYGKSQQTTNSDSNLKKIKINNVSDSFYPLQGREEKEFEFESDCQSFTIQNDEFAPTSIKLHQKSIQFDIPQQNPQESNKNCAYKKSINSTCIQIDQKANKLLSKIKNNPINIQSNQETKDKQLLDEKTQQDQDQTIKIPSSHLISQINQPASPKSPGQENAIDFKQTESQQDYQVKM